MTNYYDELKLDSTASPAALQEELIRLEMLWHEREMNRPEIAAKKLVLITEAKKVFASEATKAQYDRELNAVPEETAPEDPDAARKAQFARWVGDAVDYYQQGQYDLAKTAIERAMSYGSGEEDAAFHHIAAQIYYRNGEYSTAMSSVNKAIVSRADMAEYYLTKGLIYEGQYLEAVRNRFNNAQTYAVQERETLRRAAATAVRTGDRGVQGRALGYLAFSLYNHTPQDAAQAEQAAQEAVSVGDDWGNARRVLDDIAQKRAAEKERREKAEQEAAARREKLEAEKRAAQEKLEAEKRAAQEKLKAAAREKAARRRNWLIFLGLCVVVGILGLICLRHNLSSIGARVSYRYEESTGTLTVRGRGDTRDFPDAMLLGMGTAYAPWEAYRDRAPVVDSLGGFFEALAASPCTAGDVQTLVIEDGITSIGEELFNFPNLTGTLTVPASVRAIGTCAFEDTGALETILLSDTVEVIEHGAFTGHTTIVYDGTLEQWTQIGSTAHDAVLGDSEVAAGGFNTRRAYAIQCTNGSITHEEENGNYYGSERDLIVEYAGTLEEFDAAFGWIDPENSDTGLVKQIYCADGEIDGETGTYLSYAQNEAAKEENYAAAETALAEGDAIHAAMLFGAAGDYSDARERSLALWNEFAERPTISAGNNVTLALRSDGTVVAAGNNDYSQCDVGGWTDIVAVSAGYSKTVGLRSDGTLAVAADTTFGAEEWTDIAAVTVKFSHVFGLKTDGSVITTWNPESYPEACAAIAQWTDITAIANDELGDILYGVRCDGTVVTAGSDSLDSGKLDVGDWTDITAVAAGGSHVAGLRSDGTVVAAGCNDHGECDVSGWTDIVAIGAGWHYTAGLRSDGTVLVTGIERYGVLAANGWTGIAELSAGDEHIVGLRSDGTVIATEWLGDQDYYYGECDVSGWSDIRLPD